MAETITDDAASFLASQGIVRRPATDDDLDFLRAVYHTTRADEMAIVPWDEVQKTAFLDMQFRAQHTFYHEQFPKAAYDILLQCDVPIGRIYIDSRLGEVRVMDIAILPEYRDRGIGSALMRAVMYQSAASGSKVTLHVETFNRAQTLYRRLGFTPIQTDGIYIYMEWKSDDARS